MSTLAQQFSTQGLRYYDWSIRSSPCVQTAVSLFSRLSPPVSQWVQPLLALATGEIKNHCLSSLSHGRGGREREKGGGGREEGREGGREKEREGGREGRERERDR